MTDQCRIVRDPGGTDDWVLDEVTLALTKEAADDLVVYRGQCLVSAKKRQGKSDDDSAGFQGSDDQYAVYVPHNAPAILPGDLVVVDRSADPSLKSETLTVQSVVRQTILVWRELDVSRFETARG